MSKNLGAVLFLACLALLPIAVATGAQTPGVAGIYEGVESAGLSGSIGPNSIGGTIDPNGISVDIQEI